MTELKCDVTINPPSTEEARYGVVTKLVGGHVEEQYADTSEQAEELKAQILERLERATDHLGSPSLDCDAG